MKTFLIGLSLTARKQVGSACHWFGHR